MKKIWKAIVEFIKKLFSGDIVQSIPSWDKCTKSSNWHGTNASQRMMNMLSPAMPNEVFNSYLSWIKSRGCNCVHVFLTNKADGQYAKYSIYGPKFDFQLNNDYVKIMLDRVKKFRNENLGVVLWLISDDSSDWSKTMIKNPDKFVEDVNNAGFFKYASTVVVGLETDEYWSAAECSKMYAAVRQRYSGKIGVHQTSNKCNYAGTADIMFAQMNPGSSKSQIQSFVKTCLKTGKPVNMFELERQEDRQRSQWALEAGAFACGNW